MAASPPVLLAAYAGAIFLASVAGGWLSEYGAMTHRRTQIVMSFVAGFILGIAVFHLLPHGLERIPGPSSFETAALWIMFGMVAMIVLLRVFDFHQHDFSAEAAARGRTSARRHGLFGVALGLGLHTVTEGAALGASVRVGFVEEGVLPGLGVCLAILLHKPLDAYSITGMMKHAGHTARARLAANLAYALVCPVVAVGSYLGAGMLGPIAEGPMIGRALVFAVGAFVCISLSDLLPEIHFHRHDRGKLLAALAVGIGLAYALYLVEAMAMHAGHGDH
ncbi:MAG: ZIP family metal transporter [Gammaproteobacteria bacterium]|nr:ZIP family metal transporter [Gammaproteobacteria bacterium]